MVWPRTGLFRMCPINKRIFLNKDKWFTHILEGHPELQNCVNEVLAAIEYPEAIHRDAERNSYLSYRWCERIGKFIMVVYQVKTRNGHVKTTYTLHNPYYEVERLPKIWP